MGAAPGDYQFSFEFGAPLGIGVAVLLLIAAAVAVVLFWRPRLAELAPGRRRALIFLRAATLVLLLFMLFDPRLVGRHVAQGEDFVLVLFDDSRSMRIAGDDGVSRGDRLLHAWQASRPDFEERLRREHQLAIYRFGRVPSRLADVTDLAFDEGESDPIAAVTGAVRDLAGAHVSAVVLFSDGVRQIGDANAVPTDLEGDVPVFTVGVDTEAPWRDLELRSVSVARTNFDRSPVALTAHVVAEGLAGRDAVIEAVESDRVVASRPIRIDGDSFETRVRLEYVPQGKTWLASQVRVRLADPADDAAGTERVLENNSQGYVVDNRQKTYRILYFSGRPNWQNTFVRRAVEGDDELDIATLVRISGAQRSFEFRGGRNPYGALNNPLFEGFTEDEVNSPRYDEAVFLRIHVDEDQLTNGYPMEAEDLFPFDLVILGDIEAITSRRATRDHARFSSPSAAARC